jgi:predicted RNase H-like HicB family nuclease
MTRTLTAVLIREDDGFVALCPEIDVASQGSSVEEAKANLREAVELFFECASAEEVKDRLASESYVSSLEVSVARSIPSGLTPGISEGHWAKPALQDWRD